MEELIIRVKIDGFQGGAEESGSGGQAAGAASGAGVATNNNKFSQVAIKGESNINKLLQQGGSGVSFKANPNDVVRTHQGVFRSQYKIGGQFVDSEGQMIPGTQTTISAGRGTLTGSFVDEQLGSKFTPKAITAGASAAMWKTISAASSIAQHRSGDSYYNQQLQNGIRLAGYAATIAMSGPFAPIVATGIVVNETFNAVVGAINFNYDRNMEGQQIRNIKLLAGDVSYGRNRGGV